MTFIPKTAQFRVDARLQEHLSENGATLSELLIAIGDIYVISALAKLQSGSICCAKCQEQYVEDIVDSLCGAYGTRAAKRPDFDAAVRWHGAKLSEVDFSNSAFIVLNQ